MKKCGQHPIGEFEGWPASKDKERELVYFAVKKEHDMNFKYDKYLEVLTYDELILQAIQSGERKFEYHSKVYMIHSNLEGGYDVLCEDEKVAEVLNDAEESVVVIDDRKRKNIRNTESKYYFELYKDDLESVRKKEYPKIPQKEER